MEEYICLSYSSHRGRTQPFSRKGQKEELKVVMIQFHLSSPALSADWHLLIFNPLYNAHNPHSSQGITSQLHKGTLNNQLAPRFYIPGAENLTIRTQVRCFPLSQSVMVKRILQCKQDCSGHPKSTPEPQGTFVLPNVLNQHYTIHYFASPNLSPILTPANLHQKTEQNCCGIFVYCVRIYCCDLCNKKPNGQDLGRRDRQDFWEKERNSG